MYRFTKYSEIEAEIAKWKMKYQRERGTSIELDLKNEKTIRILEEMIFEKILFEDAEDV